MDASERGALMLTRFVAACLMGMSVVELALYAVEYKFRNVPVNVLLSALWVVLFLAGVAVLIKAKAVAEWISDKLD
jgi:4-hydroxybenzoate polyprenyltransferase